MALLFHSMLLKSPAGTGSGTAGLIRTDYSTNFNGTSNYKLYEEKFSITNDFSWSIFINSDFSKNQMIIDQRESNQNGLQPLYISSEKRIQFHIAPSQTWEFDASKCLISDTWNHIAIVLRKSILYVYVNGKLLNQNGNHVLLPFDDVEFPLYIGRRFDVNSTEYYFFKGLIADIRLYNHALTYAEIQSIPEKLVLHYSFSDNVNNKFLDRTHFEQTPINVSYSFNASSNLGTHCASFSKASEQHIRLPASAKIRVPFSYNIWVYMDDWTNFANDTNRFLSCTDSGGYNIEAPINKIVFAFYDGSGDSGYDNNINTEITVDSLGQRSWHMFTFTVGDGISYPKKAIAYIDGEEVGQVEYTGTFTYNESNAIYLGAEANPSNPSIYFDGKISDFRLYATVLSTDTIADLYTCRAKIYKKGSSLISNRVAENAEYLGINSSTGVSSPNLVENNYLITPDGAKFLQVLSHDTALGTECFSTSNVTNSIGRNRFSKLDYFNLSTIRHYEDENDTVGKYEILLRYPQAANLPDGYEPLEYIESWSIRCDTLIDNQTCVFYHDIHLFPGLNRQLMGFDGNTGSYWGVTTNGKFEIEGHELPISANQRCIVKFKYGDTQHPSSLSINGNTYLAPRVCTSTGGNYSLFGLNNNSYYCNARLYRFTAYSADPDTHGAGKVADFFPCIRTEDSCPGLYDIIRNRFISTHVNYKLTPGPRKAYSGLMNRWKQSHNPLTSSTSAGYSSNPLDIQLLGYWDYTGIGYFGANALLECQLSHEYWHGGVGLYNIYTDGVKLGFPAPDSKIYPSQELYIRIDNTAFGEELYLTDTAIHAGEIMEE